MSESLQFVLSALGYAVLCSIWQMGLIWLVVILFSHIHKNLSPSALSTISFIALVVGFIAFVTTFIIHLYRPDISTALLRWNHVAYIYQFTHILAWVYLGLLVIPFIKFTIGVRSVYHLRRQNLGRVPGHYKIFLLNAIQYLGIKRKVSIFTSALINTPLTAGFFKPVILLPVAIINQLSVEQVEAIILHELAHIKRNDYLQNLITQIILTLLYFNPFARMLARLQCNEREKSADKWVTRFEYNSYMYANTLLEMARAHTIAPATLAVHISSKKTPLRERIEWILGSTQRSTVAFKQILCSVVMVLAALGFAAIQKPNPTTPLLLLSSTDVATPVAYQVASTSTLSHYTPEVMVSPQPMHPSSREKKTKSIKQKSPVNESAATVIEVIPVDVITEDEPVIITTYVSKPIEVVPLLSEAEESQVQDAIALTKKLISEYNWKILESALAESITEEEKRSAKRIFIEKLEASADWEKQATLLRQNYHNIDWEAVNEQLSIVAQIIIMDSLYTQYKDIVIDNMVQFEKYIEVKNIQKKSQPLDSIHKKADAYNIMLRSLDSLSHKKTIEL